MAAFHLKILATDRPFFDGLAESVIVPVTDGEQEFLAYHSPFVAAIVPGKLIFRVPGEAPQLVAVGSGIAKVADNEVLVLVDSVERPEEIDANRAQRDLEAAKEAMRQKQSVMEYRLAQAHLARAVSRLRVKGYSKLE